MRPVSNPNIWLFLERFSESEMILVSNEVCSPLVNKDLNIKSIIYTVMIKFTNECPINYTCLSYEMQANASLKSGAQGSLSSTSVAECGRGCSLRRTLLIHAHAHRSTLCPQAHLVEPQTNLFSQHLRWPLVCPTG